MSSSNPSYTPISLYNYVILLYTGSYIILSSYDQYFMYCTITARQLKGPLLYLQLLLRDNTKAILTIIIIHSSYDNILCIATITGATALKGTPTLIIILSSYDQYFMYCNDYCAAELRGPHYITFNVRSIFYVLQRLLRDDTKRTPTREQPNADGAETSSL